MFPSYSLLLTRHGDRERKRGGEVEVEEEMEERVITLEEMEGTGERERRA